MSKLSRVTQLIFGSTALSNQRTQFGSLANGTPNGTADPTTIQSLPNWLSGWFAAVIGNNSPAIEDMNGMCFVFARQIAYIFENGISEYDSATTYYIGSMVRELGGLRVYSSLTNNNTGNALSSTANWAPYGASVKTVTSDYTALVTDNIIRSNTTSVAITITLPTIASSIGQKFTIKDVGSGAHVTEVHGNGSETIDGNIIYSTDLNQYDSVSVYNNGTTWDVL